MVIKRSGRVEPFQDLEMLALAEAPQITSERLGREALDRLRVLDEVAYLRFASVYKSFRDATDFQRELTELEEEQMGSAQVER